MAKEPPNYRYGEVCQWCKHSKCVHSCGCCPSEFVCTLHGDYDVYDGETYVCDDFEKG